MTTAKVPNEDETAGDASVKVPTPTFTETETPLLGNEALSSLQKSVEALTKKLDDVEKQQRGKQGDIDRLQKDYSGLREAMSAVNQMKARGMTDEDAVSEVEYRQTVKRLADRLEDLTPQSAQPAGRGTSGAAREAQEIVQQLELDSSDPDVVALLGGQYRNLDHLEAEAAKLKLRKSTKPAPSSSAAPPVVGGGSSSEETTEDLVSRFNEAKKFPTSPEYKVIKAELEKRGWK